MLRVSAETYPLAELRLPVDKSIHVKAESVANILAEINFKNRDIHDQILSLAFQRRLLRRIERRAIPRT